jgi:hypothetical protein
MDIFTPPSNPLNNPLIPVQDDPLGLKSLNLSSGLPSIPQIPDEIIAGDISRDGGVDNADSNLIYADRGKPVIGTEDPRDIDRDGRITLRDVALLSRTVQGNTDKTGPLLGLDLINDLNGVTDDPLIGGTITDTNRVTRFKAGLEGKAEADYFNIRGTIGNDGSFTLDKGRLEEINNGPLNDGLHTLSFFAKDKWNNITRSSIVFTLDTTKPVIEVGLSNDTGSSSVDQITSLADITGKITEANTISSFKAGFDNTELNNFIDITAQLKADKTFSLDSSILKLINGNVDLNQGQHTLKLIAIDGVGNATDTIGFTFTLDTIAPTKPNFALDSAFDAAPLGDSRTNFAQVVLYGQTEGNIKVSLVGTDKQTTASATGQFTFTDVALDIGNNSLTVQALDLAGNSSLFTAQIDRVTETSSDVVIDWNATLLNAIRTDKTNPPLASRNMAIVHAAIFDAVNGITGDYNPYHVTETGPAGASAEAAAASAAHRVLVSLYPSQKPSFDQALTASLAQVTEGVAKTAGVSYGERVGDAILLLRSNDGSNQTVNYTPGTNPGEWRPTPPGFAPPLYPHWGTVTPFAMTDGSQFRPDGPPALNSQEYTTEYNLVKDLGKLNSTTRTADQTEIAKFWADGGGTFTPPGHWNQIAEQIAANTNSSLVENARLFALLNIGLADAGITSWDGKYTYNFWRPITAIREGDNDGNADTVGDFNWTSLIGTHPFPEYTSGHSTFSGAGSTILGGIFGNSTSFVTNSLGLPGVNRSFNSFSGAADEAGISRIYGGIHFPSANEDGLASGRALGAYVLGNFLLPKAGDTIPPNITAALVSDTGSSNSDRITNNPNIAGVVTDSSAITSFRAKLDNGTFVDVLGTLQNGSFTLDNAKLREINGNTDLSQGAHSLILNATDLVGNISETFTYSFTLDSDSPIAAITSNLSNEPTSLDVTISEVISEAFYAQSSYSLKVVGGANDGQAVVINALTKVSDTLVRLSLATPLTAGNYQLAIAPEVKDTAGNSLANLTLDFTATPPTLAFAPLNGEGMVSLTRDGVVRFGTKVKPETVTNEAFYLIANGQRLAGQVKVSSTNEFATFLPDEILPASTEVRMVVDGSKILSQNGVAIDADGDGLVGGIGTADFTTLPIVRIAGTDVWGYVYDSYNKNPDGTDKPLEGVEIRLDFLPDVKAVTDANGYFILEDVPAPEFFVYIDGSKAANVPAGTQYASLGKAFHSVPGQSTQLFMDGVPFNIYLPPMFAGDVKALSTTENTDVGFGEASKALLQQALPDIDPSVWDEVKVTFAPGSAQDRQGNAATQAMIVPVAPDRLPAPLPPGVDPKLVISIQAGGANGFNREAQGGATTFDVPAPLQFPNLEGLKPGEKSLFWSFDHTAGEWIVIGTGTVSEDGKVIKSDPGVGVLAPGWHFVNPGTPTNGPTKPDKPDDCDPDVFTIENAIDLFEQVTKCTAGFFKIQGLIAKVFEIASEAKSLIGSADKLSKGLEDGSLNASDVQALFQSINSTKKILKSTFDGIKDQNPLGKALAISKCLENLLGFSASVCGKITEQDSGCNTIAVKTVCNGLDLAKSTLGKVNSLIEKAEEGLKESLFALACGTIDQIASLLGFAAQNEGARIGVNSINIQAESDTVSPETLEELKTLVPKLIGEMEGFLVNAEAGAEMGEILEDVGQQIGDLEPSVGQMAGELLDYPANAYYLIEYGNFASRGRTDANGQFDTILAPNTQFKLSIYDAQSGRIATYTGKTTASGFATEIPALAYVTTEGIAKVYQQQGIDLPEDLINELSDADLYGLPDSDNDGLVDEAENIIGTTANKKDTDNDGINDLAEIQQGLDPLGGQAFPTGIISSLPLFGEAKAITVTGSTTNTQNQTAYVATGSYGLAIVNASQFNNPIILGQLDLPGGDATDVAVDTNLQIAAVASNNGGLQLVDVSDPMLPVLKQTININASQVEVVDGIAYATVGTSLRAVDLLSGEQIQQVTLPGSGTVTGLARDGSYLYGFISGPDIFFTVDISNSAAVTLKGQLTVSIASTDVGVFAGNGVAYLAGSGMRTINISNPANPTLISDSDLFFTARNIALNGSGLALIASESQGIGVYDITDPQNTNNVVFSVDTPGFTYGVALASGIAYVADGTGGLQVINYLPFDNKGVAPTVTITSSVVDLDPNQTGIQITEGGSISIQANVTDDVQVRNVELLVNGQVVSNDVSFPFDLQAIALSNDPNAPVVNVQARVTDTGGNTSLSNILTFDLVPDTIAPKIDSFSANIRTATIRFSEALDTTNITAANFTLINSSNQTIVPENIQFRDGDRTIQLTYPALAVGNYQLVIDAAQLSDRAGNALGVEDVIKMFSIANTIVLDFESLRIDGASLTDVGSNYIEDNFTISKARQDFLNLYSINSGDFRWNGSTSLFNNTINGTITLTQNEGGTFSLNSIDLDWLNGGGSVPVNFVGTKSDNSSVNARFDLDFSKGFQTFNFTEFTNLVSVSWRQESAFHQFDNIVVALQ